MRYLMFLFAVVSVLLCVGCNGGKSEPITMKVVHIATETGSWGCISTNKKTYFRSDDGRVDSWCGEWGKPGDEVAGYWHTGNNITPENNGFRRFE